MSRPNSWHLVALLMAFTFLCAEGAACTASGGEACAPGDWEYCSCPGTSAPGYEQCVPSGSGYGTCDCSGQIPAGAGVLLLDAGAPDTSASDTGGPAGFLGNCMQNSDCESNLCFPFNAYGPHCTKPCAHDVDCPAPSPGCSNMGVCKLH